MERTTKSESPTVRPISHTRGLSAKKANGIDVVSVTNAPLQSHPSSADFRNAPSSFSTRKSIAPGKTTAIKRALSQHTPITATFINAWKAMTQAQREQIGKTGFASEHNLNLFTWRRCVNMKGNAAPTGQAILSRAAGHRYASIAAEHIESWLGMTQKQREKIGLIGFANKHNLNPSTWPQYVNMEGRAKAFGQYNLNRTAGCHYTPITTDHIKAWQGITQKQRNKIGLNGFANKHNLDLYAWRHRVNLTGNITPRGQAILDKEEGNTHARTTAKHIETWMTMTQSQRNEIGLAEFAKKHAISSIALRKYVTNEGKATPPGQVLLEMKTGHRYTAITAEHIEWWQKMTQENREKIGVAGFADKYNLNFSNFQQRVKVTGEATHRGKATLRVKADKSYVRITPGHIETWQAMTQQQREKIGLTRFAEKHNLNKSTLRRYAKLDGQTTSRGKVWLKSIACPYARPTVKHLESWQGMTQSQREKIGLSGFANEHNLHPIHMVHECRY